MTAVVVVNEKSEDPIEVLDASTLFDRHRSRLFSARSFFHASEEKRRNNSLIRQFRIYCSFDGSNYMQQNKANIGNENRRISRKRKLEGNLQSIFLS